MIFKIIQRSFKNVTSIRVHKFYSAPNLPTRTFVSPTLWYFDKLSYRNITFAVATGPEHQESFSTPSTDVTFWSMFRQTSICCAKIWFMSFPLSFTFFLCLPDLACWHIVFTFLLENFNTGNAQHPVSTLTLYWPKGISSVYHFPSKTCINNIHDMRTLFYFLTLLWNFFLVCITLLDLDGVPA